MVPQMRLTYTNGVFKMLYIHHNTYLVLSLSGTPKAQPLRWLTLYEAFTYTNKEKQCSIPSKLYKIIII